jgi:uncharacterized phage protein (TIGR01671 family)
MIPQDLKFRVWDGFTMNYNITVGKFGTFYVNPGDKGDGLMSGDSASLTQFTTKYSDSVPVMQWTGLKDINGTEIYEGDIVNLQPDQDDKIWHRVIDFDTAAFHCRAIHTNANHPLHFHKFSPDRKWVVIGNIWKNPELLNCAVGG